MEGKVKFFNATKGFGFIKGEDENDYFVHTSQVPQEIELEENDAVIFEPTSNDKGYSAESVQLA